MESAIALHGEENRLIEERTATRYEFGYIRPLADRYNPGEKAFRGLA